MMGIRQEMNDNRKLGVGVGVAIILVGAALVGMQFRGPTNAAAVTSTKAFYTDDGGKTFFTDNVNKLVPFDHNGKQAYRADVFRFADGKEFVGLIYRHTDSGRKEMEGYIANGTSDPDGLVRHAIEQRGMQVKRVGADDKGWAMNDDVTTERLQASIKGPAGKPAELVTP